MRNIDDLDEGIYYILCMYLFFFHISLVTCNLFVCLYQINVKTAKFVNCNLHDSVRKLKFAWRKYVNIYYFENAPIQTEKSAKI